MNAIFTQTEGLAIQAADLAGWRKVLVPTVYAKLEARAKRVNAALKPTQNGYAVWRGDELTQFVRDLCRTEPTA